MWEKLEKILEEKGLNRNQLAKLSDVDRSHFTNLKNGTTKYLSWPNMVKIADALDISLDYFR
ncbi:helix-turn-helix domain-containing protein [Streptococcus jiangjianxini]|uniref:helix-turn-helix domain-containing protein n=1 Tax=Streptococcus jiangjianxini TaxID=3161189 RepID=UPI0032ECEBC3